MRVECWVKTSVPAHPKGCCCGVYKGTTSPHTPQGMLLWGLQRYYLSPHTPRDGAVRFTKVLPLPTHPKGCYCGVYKGTTSPHTPQGMLLWGLQRYYLSPHTPRDGAVRFTKVLPLPTHPKGCYCGVYKGTTSPHTPQGMLLWGLQRYYLSPHTPRDCAVRFTKVLPLPTHPKGCYCGVYKGTTSPHTPQGMLLWGLQRYYLSPHTPRDAAVGFTMVLPLPRHPTHPKGCCCGVYKGTTSPHTPQGMLLWGLQRYYLSPHTPRDSAVGFTKVLPLPHTPQGILLWGLQRYYLSPHTPRDAAVGFTKVLPLPTHPKGCCCGVYKGTTSPHTPFTPQGMLLWGLQRYYLFPHTSRDAAVGFTKVLRLPRHPVQPCLDLEVQFAAAAFLSPSHSSFLLCVLLFLRLPLSSSSSSLLHLLRLFFFLFCFFFVFCF